MKRVLLVSRVLLDSDLIVLLKKCRYTQKFILGWFKGALDSNFGLLFQRSTTTHLNKFTMLTVNLDRYRSS